ncbi:MAG TPA: response regulator transcription factor [Campylobacterales bacterium]|nr:response regulator transcription factor [Campylobacterales bacterium]
MKYDVTIFKNLSVLIAEDNQTVLAETTKALSLLFGKATPAKDGLEAYELYEEIKPDLIITDVKMPNLSGIELIKKIRERDVLTPIVLISSYSDQPTLLKALNLGVDGYIIKPIEPEELLAACYNGVRLRNESVSNSVIKLKNGLEYDFASKKLSINGSSVDLGAREQALIRLFLHAKGKTLNKQEIIDELWPIQDVSDSALKSVIGRLRKKIGEELIINVKGGGWQLPLE